MFGRGRTGDEAPEVEERQERDGAKNRPTPKRRDQEAARKRPLVVTDRKEAKRQDRLKRREQLARTRRALETGDEAHLPPRDKGPVRRFIRDYVDARRNIAELLLPVMLVVLALSLVRNQLVFSISVLLTWTSVFVVAVDTFLMWRGLKRKAVEKFGADALGRGSGYYAVLRAFQMRRQRMPRAQVERGQYPT
ncbi:DUF3043 domain-containing protein [Phycicoccus sp. CSK15P-2]|uniref:DUF3043 domain-containing protein n=1 Tax=Phycicoccus sp. CSK15P-2 TaxID=2807627 RepID=UPI0019513066|nr:DUF3043 domain-containing protein [Phycicoccus sp. CSK15P-2]MBM6404072.1 DUF3043 domain-containing protein [Phycicoccus sp. CSK15P-2]